MSEEEIKHLMQSHYNLHEKYEQLKLENQQLKLTNQALSGCLKIDKEKIDYYVDRCEQLEQVLDEIRTYIEKHRQIYDIDGSIEKQIDEFDILASPKRILEMIDKVKE